jgi:hypothetical protein
MYSVGMFENKVYLIIRNFLPFFELGQIVGPWVLLTHHWLIIFSGAKILRN